MWYGIRGLGVPIWGCQGYQYKNQIKEKLLYVETGRTCYMGSVSGGSQINGSNIDEPL